MLGAAMIGGSLLSGLISSNSANKAADAQVKGIEAGIEEQRRQADRAYDDKAPYRQSGYNGLAAYNYELGLGPSPGITPEVVTVPGQQIYQNQLQTAPSNQHIGNLSGMIGGLGGGSAYGGLNGNGAIGSSPARYLVSGKYYDTEEEAQAAADAATFDYTGFQETPGYQYAVDQGEKAIERRASAMGQQYSGGTLQRLQEHSQGLANQEYGTHLNRLAGLAGIGQTSVQSSAALGAQTAGNISNSLAAAGDARASGYTGNANALNGTLNNLATVGGMYQGGYFGNSGGTANALSTPWAAGGFWG